MKVKVAKIENTVGDGYKTYVAKGYIKSGVRLLPDIDIDFPPQRINEVKEYIRNKYGYDHFCAIGTYSRMQLKSALKDVAREFGIDPKLANYYNSLINPKGAAKFDWDNFWKQALTDSKLQEFIKKYPAVLDYTELLLGQFRNTGVHASANIITPNQLDGEPANIYDFFPVKKVGDLLISEYEGGEMDEIGFLKEDILSVADLDKIKMCLDLVEKHTGEKIDIFSLPEHDPEVFKYFQKGYTQDVFQFSEAGLKNFLMELKPDTIEDLYAANALWRPATMESGTHKHYVQIKHGLKVPEHDKFLEHITEKTYGLTCYQEQTMASFKTIANATLAEAEVFRKFITKMKGDPEKDSRYLTYKAMFIDGYKKLGVDEPYAIVVWNKLLAFAGYGFNRCIAGNEILLFETGERVDIHTLYSCYNPSEYPVTYSLDENGEAVLNKIKSINYAGFKELVKITLKNEAVIRVTGNHKFPTQNGEKMAELLNPFEDMLYVFDKENNYVHLVEIERIERDDSEKTYDVTMETPYHTYTTSQGIMTCNSHAVAYAKLSWVDQWLKVHKPVYFWLAALSFTRKDEAIPKKLIEIYQTVGDIVRLPDINISTDKFEGSFDEHEDRIYWAISKVYGIGDAKLNKILTERELNGKFFSLGDFCSRVNLPLKDLINLILCGCFDKLHKIKTPMERRDLIQIVCQIKGEPFPTEYITGDAIKPFWWQLKTQDLCGFSYIDYTNMVPKEIKSMWLTPHDFDAGKGNKTLRCHAGVVLSVKERKDKNGNYFASLEINQNNYVSHLTIWSDSWESYRTRITKGKLLIYTGIVKFDSYKNAYTIQTCQDSTLIVK